ncbi:acidic leucine-rich nuclear phosphoprotein 32 family member A-like [Stegodyphus dumicola]|uniref:acidic leucine-rich nuclear phosphoprotein 32 family member A-like n=1 Tax=Stegodyphus dumicola TaxID=202533 RepID=UPI0015AD8C0B|nr:acidic leucine-rich nuclear phosphoprotein 32 family member A-like [Stegodyphus dumicola]
MEKRIELEKRGKDPAQIKELVLDNCRSTSIVGLTEEFVNLQSLSLINIGLTNLKGFPKLPNLEKLELSDNRISGGLNYLSGSHKLTTLNLSGNKIESLETLEPLKELKNLKHLDLSNCEVSSVDNYREKVFALLPQLKYLDGYDQDDKSDEEYEKPNDLYQESDEDEEEDVEEEEDDEEEEVGLSYLQNSIDEESEGDDYNPDGSVESDVDIEDDADEEEKDDNPRGQKRKLENDD